MDCILRHLHAHLLSFRQYSTLMSRTPGLTRDQESNLDQDFFQSRMGFILFVIVYHELQKLL